MIVLFTAFTGLAQGDRISVRSFINIPVSVVVGIIIGMAVGIILAKYFEKIPIRDTSKVIVLMCSSFILITIEDKWGKILPFASLIAVMAIGIALQKKRACVAKRLSVKFNKLWVGAEVMLFVLVGATVDIKYALSSGVSAVILILEYLHFEWWECVYALLKQGLAEENDCFA